MSSNNDSTDSFRRIDIDRLRIKVDLAPDLRVRFVGRDLALRKIIEWAERGVSAPIVVYGPEGCGKTTWLRQSVEVLKTMNYKVVYINLMERSLEKALVYSEDLKDLVREFISGTLQMLGAPLSSAIARLIDLAPAIAHEMIKRFRKPKIAILIDEAFQIMRPEEAAVYVKTLLNIIEHPSAEYDRIVAVVATSEGRSRSEIGRHRWAHLMPMWNMSKNDFRQLYDQIPGEKPSFENVWRITGGNPWVFRELYMTKWNINSVIIEMTRSKDLTPYFVDRWRSHLEKAIEDPDHLWHKDVPKELIDEMIKRDLIIYNMYERDPVLWIDQPPPRKDLEIGVGEEVAWQTPLHRESVRRALEKMKKDQSKI